MFAARPEGHFVFVFALCTVCSTHKIWDVGRDTATQLAELNSVGEVGMSDILANRSVRVVILILTFGVVGGGGYAIGHSTADSGTAVTATTTTKPASAAAIVDQAIKLQSAGDAASARKLYVQAIQKDPQNKLAYYNIGLIDQSQGRVDDAENEYRLAIAVDGKFANALFNLAIIRTAKGATDEAIELYQRSVTSNPKLANGYFNMGLLMYKKGDKSGGIAAIKQGIVLDAALAKRVPTGVKLDG